MHNPPFYSVAVLVDLPRKANSGGHVKCWERLAEAAVELHLPISLTVYFSGPERTEKLSDFVTLRQLPPILSTERLRFLPYVPDHTDLASFHPRLANELKSADLIHTTDAYFAYAKTAIELNKKYHKLLTTSTHTDTVSYTRVFTTLTLKRLLRFSTKLQSLTINRWQIPERQAAQMQRRLSEHIRHCTYALVTRSEDHRLADSLLGKERTRHLRMGVNKSRFSPTLRNRQRLLKEYGIPESRKLFLFVGRVDIGKNVITLTEALYRVKENNNDVHLLIAGEGPSCAEIKSRLGDHVTLLGYTDPTYLAMLYASVDALCLCSEIEIYSMVAVEALASGCPVLVSEKSEIYGLFNKTPAMLPVPSGVMAWVDALERFIESEAGRKEMHEQALKDRETRLASWQDILKEDIYPVWEAALREVDRENNGYVWEKNSNFGTAS